MTGFTRISHTHTIQIDSPPADVFPLFGPVRESDWADGWTITPVYAQTALLEEPAAIFLTEHPGEQTTIWFIHRYDREALLIEYLRITPESRFGIVTVRCEDTGTGQTRVAVTYTFSALSAQGETYLADFTAERYQRMIAHWEQAINHFLKTGETLPGH